MSYLCTICQENLLFQIEDKDEQAYALRCGHVFHNKCLSQWKKNVNKCPQCRATAQHPVRLFFIAEADGNREELDIHTMKVELEKEKTSNYELKKKNKDMAEELSDTRNQLLNLEFKFNEYMHTLKTIKDSYNNLRKTHSTHLEEVTKLKHELNEYRAKVQSFSNIQTILDENVDAVELENYKNMKPDVMAKIVNQWKKNANFYKQKEASDRKKYSQLLEEAQSYKHIVKKQEEKLNSVTQERDLLKTLTESKKLDSKSLTSPNKNEKLKKSVRSPDLFADISPLAKIPKMTISSFPRRQPLTSLSSAERKPNTGINQTKPSVLPNNYKSSLFKRAHSFKSAIDIMNHYDK